MIYLLGTELLIRTPNYNYTGRNGTYLETHDQLKIYITVFELRLARFQLAEDFIVSL